VRPVRSAVPLPAPTPARRHVLPEIALLGVSALLFALAFPSFASRWGWFPLAFVCIAPVFAVVHRASWPRIFAYGPLYGFLSYALLNSWLASWHPLGLAVVPTIYAGHFFLLFPILKLIDERFQRHGYLLQLLAWIGYEYVKTLGYLGYPYGILGYSQYLFLPLIQVASIGGVWAVSLLVAFPSVVLGNAARDGLRGAPAYLKERVPVVAVYGVALAAAIAYGLASPVDIHGLRQWKVALVQQNVDPWRGGDDAYRASLAALTRQSVEAVKQSPEIVIWSETSFVPSIDWHTRYRTDDHRYKLVRELREFLDDQSLAYVVGNNDGQKRILPSGQEVRLDYNATLLYRKGQIVDTYRKLRLVPFSEHFPFGGPLAWLHNLLQRFDIHFYEEGTEAVVYEDRGVRFSTPICFEDTFGYIGRLFVGRGADVLVNMSNDSWAFSVACQMQHMSMGIFRAVENRRSLVRSTNGGMTVIVDPNGRILKMLDPFIEGYLIGEVPIVQGVTTPYTRFGDWIAQASLAATLGLALACLVLRAVRALPAREGRGDGG
jgi:apolipoprotein N-acyltransferase